MIDDPVVNFMEWGKILLDSIISRCYRCYCCFRCLVYTRSPCDVF